MKTLLKTFLALTLFCMLVGLLGLLGAGLYFKRELPSTEGLADIELYTPLQVFSSDGELVAEFGEKRRDFVTLENVPLQVQRAFIAAEDDRFYEHPGVDWQGVARAVYVLVSTGEKAQGGSTITMQIARNLFLDNSKRYTRKIKEMLLAMQIEQELSKDQILELYLNKIFFGHRAWGIGAAAYVYYGKSLDELSLAEVAMIAGLPKAPSAYNPIANPQRAVVRRNYVLRRMRELDWIDAAQFSEATQAPVTAKLHRARQELNAGYLAEMVRSAMVEEYGDRAYSEGLRVTTTVDSRLQRAAQASLRSALHTYEERHGYVGPVTRIDAETLADPVALDHAMAEVPLYGDLSSAVVIRVDAEEAEIRLHDGGTARIGLGSVAWARERLSINELGAEITAVDTVLAVGDLIYLRPGDDGQWRLAQLPGPEGAFVAMRPDDGAIIALVGGYQFERSKFNRVMQASRQPGSNFKPFVFSAALEEGETLASVFNDAPVVFEDDKLEDEWRPENYSGRVYGPTRLREALVKSRNLVSIRLLRKIGVPDAIDYVDRFGFNGAELPRDLSLALGSGVVRPIEIVRAYGVFANGGSLVDPWFIERIEDRHGRVLFEAAPRIACDPLLDCSQPAGVAALTSASQDGAAAEALAESQPQIAPRVISADNAFLMNSVMREVVRRGTAVRAGKALGRPDVAGKTGTTNEQMDAWFTGYHPSLVATAWVGFDQVQTLGAKETGGRAALPMWIDFMQAALIDQPVVDLVPPDNIVRVRIDSETGRTARAGAENAMFEYFRLAEGAVAGGGASGTSQSTGLAGSSSQSGLERPAVRTLGESAIGAAIPGEDDDADEDIRDQLF